MTILPEPEKDPRRYDLDALRAFAMFLGIILHSALSFMPMFWPVQDTRQSEWFGVLFSAIHGFRMPLFFMLSGFFTAMLWRRRGPGSTLQQRFTRVLVPCMLGLITIVPLVNWVSEAAILSGLDSPVAANANETDQPLPESTNLWDAARAGDLASIRKFLTEETDINQPDPEYGLNALSFTALTGQTRAAALLLERGADVNSPNRDRGTALHLAAFLGEDEVADLLIQSGADVHVVNAYNAVPAQSAQADWKVTQFFAGLLKVNVEESVVMAGREKILEQLRRVEEEAAADVVSKPDQPSGTGAGWLTTAIQRPVFHHLWFLWFLCWLVMAFSVYAWIADKLDFRGLPAWLCLAPVSYLWLIPMTMVPQSWMGVYGPSIFGPDTSAGWLPMPHVLAYYAIFFGFGAMYYHAGDTRGKLGRFWWLVLPVAVLIVFPVGLEFTTGGFGFADRIADPDWRRAISVLAQAVYAWMMTFGLIGFFRATLSSKRFVVRYLSDSSYWLYVAHVPLVIGLQWLTRDWELPLMVKFLLICLVVTGFLLFTYQTCVRYTALGRLLNGPRTRKSEQVNSWQR